MIRPIDRAILLGLLKRNRHRVGVKRRTGLYPLETVNLFVTMRCNAHCGHCFCWEDLNVGIRELDLDEYERVAENFVPIRLMVVTGGEPTLRRDLFDVCSAFASRNKTEAVMINTNGLRPDFIEDFAVRFKERFPDHGLVFQLSLDGLQPTHDKIRGVKGNFDKVIDSLKRVWALKARFTNLTAVTLTVINEYNYTELKELNAHLKGTISPEFYGGYELVRDVEKTAWNILPEVKETGVGPKNMGLPPLESFDQIAADLGVISRSNPFRADAYHQHNLMQLEMVRTGRPQAKCSAGQSVGVFYSNGDIAHCEFTLPFANIAEFDYNFTELWHSDRADARRKQITGCHCIHGSFHGKAVEYDWKCLAKMAWASM